MILKRCKICSKLVWRVTDGACNACHTKHEQSKKLASTATHVSTPPNYCYNDDWQHNHRPAVLYDNDGDVIAYDVNLGEGTEIVKRVNLHNELVGCLMLARDMFVANDLILPKTLETINKCLEKCK